VITVFAWAVIGPVIMPPPGHLSMVGRLRH